jgi:rare lipoprotein A (peptidoglycan hydrolase)
MDYTKCSRVVLSFFTIQFFVGLVLGLYLGIVTTSAMTTRIVHSVLTEQRTVSVRLHRPRRPRRIARPKVRWRLWRQGTMSWYGCPASVWQSWCPWVPGGDGFNGQRTATGIRFNTNSLECATRTLPLGTKILIRNLNNGRETYCRAIDRGPYVDMTHRILDGSHAVIRAISSASIVRVAVYVQVD